MKPGAVFDTRPDQLPDQLSDRRPGRMAGGLLAAAAAAGISYGLGRLARRHPGGERWLRTNHAGAPITLLEGPIAASGALSGVLLRAALAPRRSFRQTAAELVAIGGAAVVGGYDDLFGSTQAKGFRGHLTALRHGVITSGMIKVAGIGAAGLAASVIGGSAASTAAGRGTDLMINTGLTAGTANLANLFDLRPGRAAKVIIATGALTPGAGPVVGAAAGVLPADLTGRSMLGDCGANALGAGLGVAAGRLPRPLRLAILAGIAGLTLASEKYSFTRVIERNRWLSALDELGRPLPRGLTAYGPGIEPDPGGTSPDRGRDGR